MVVILDDATTVSRVSQLNKNVFKPIFSIQRCTFEIAKETFVQIHQN